MAKNHIELNENKMEINIFGHTAGSQMVSDNLGPWKEYLQNQENWGVIFD